MDDQIRELLEDMRDALQGIAQSGTMATTSFQRLSTSTKGLTQEQRQQAQALEEARARLKAFYDSAKQVASDLGSSAQQIRDNRESFSALNPAVNSTVTVITGLGNVVGGIISTLGNTALLASISSLNPIGIAAGLGLKLAGDAAAELVGQLAQLGGVVVKFATSEIDRVVGAFRTLGRVGGITANGFTDLEKRATASGLSFQQFADVIAKGGKDLALFSGDVGEGAKRLSEISAASAGTRQQLLNLGIGFVQQNELLAESLAFNQRIGRTQRNDTASLSRASQDYAFRLVTLSKLTGESVDQVKAQLDQARSQARLRGELELAVAAARATGDEGDRIGTALDETFQLLSSVNPRLAEAFSGSLRGTLANEASREVQQLLGGAFLPLVTQLRAGTIDSVEFFNQLRTTAEANKSLIASTEAVAGGLGAFGDATRIPLLDLANRSELAGASFEEILAKVQAAANTQDDQTKTVSDAQIALQKFAQSLDTFVIKSMPSLTGAVNTFVKVLVGPDGQSGLLGSLVAAMNSLIDPDARQKAAEEQRRKDEQAERERAEAEGGDPQARVRPPSNPTGPRNTPLTPPIDNPLPFLNEGEPMVVSNDTGRTPSPSLDPLSEQLQRLIDSSDAGNKLIEKLSRQVAV